MVSEYRFIPTGYLGTEQAAVLLAELVAPANWQDETFLPGEHVLWNELGRKLSAEFIELSLIELRERAKERNSQFFPDAHALGRFRCRHAAATEIFVCRRNHREML